jgi:hypothetical protein
MVIGESKVMVLPEIAEICFRETLNKVGARDGLTAEA